MMKLTPEDQRRLLRTLRLTERIHSQSFRENDQTGETRPKRGGRAFRKRRSFRA